ncbi:MAG: hypothetical protein K8L97_05645 [Anaerolineae bacterium]|nr:hypothetical protein [Anaerolineae bacterium]
MRPIKFALVLLFAFGLFRFYTPAAAIEACFKVFQIDTNELLAIYDTAFTDADFNGRDTYAFILVGGNGAGIEVYYSADLPEEGGENAFMVPLASLQQVPPAPYELRIYDLVTGMTPYSGNGDPNDYAAWMVNNAVLVDSMEANTEDANCPNIDEPAFQDGRENNDPGAEAVVYTPDGGGIQVYEINNSSDGTLTVYVPTENVEQAPVPDTNTEVTANADGNIVLYRLETGEWQVNVGPDAEGKTTVYILSGDTLSLVRSYQFGVYDSP